MDIQKNYIHINISIQKGAQYPETPEKCKIELNEIPLLSYQNEYTFKDKAENNMCKYWQEYKATSTICTLI